MNYDIGDDVLNAGDHVYCLINGKLSFSTIVSEILPDGSLYAERPIVRGKLLPCESGDSVDVFFYRDQGIYTFSATLTRCFVQYQVPMMHFRVTSGMVHRQRRRYNRLAKNLPVSVRINVDENNQVHSIDVQAETLDISAGGSRIRLPAPVSCDTPMQCRIRLTDTKQITLDSVVVHVIGQEDAEDQSFQVGVRFENMNDRTKRSLAGYIFEEQRRQISPV